MRILLRHYTKIGVNGGIAKVIYDDEFEEIADEIIKAIEDDKTITEHGTVNWIT